MRGRLFQSLWLRRFHRPNRKNSQLLFSTILGFIAALLLIHQFDVSIRPQLIALAKTQIRNQLTLIADQTVAQVLDDQSLSYSDMVILQRVPGEDITTLTTDTVRLNTFRSAVMEQVIQQVKLLDKHSLGIPFGVLTGLDALSALGPEFPVKVLSVASVESSYRNDFTSAGINQTLHRIFLDITITTELLLPGGIVEAEISTPVCVAETVIIGQVPQTYLNWGQ